MLTGMKVLCFFLCAALAFSSFYAAETLIEAKGSFYYPTSPRFRHIYSEGGLFGAEASFRAYEQLFAWISGSFTTMSGHSLGLHDSTRIAFYPFGAGIKYFWPIKFADIYLGAGGLGVFMHIHDQSSYTPPKINRWGGGAILKGGCIFNCSKHLFVDLFSDYSFLYVPVPKHPPLIKNNANLSGWSAGIGIGYRFGSGAMKQP